MHFYRGWQGVTWCYSGLRGVTGNNKGLQKTCSLTRTSPDTFSWSICITRLQGVTVGDKGWRGYKRLQWVTRVTGANRGLQGVTWCDSGLWGVTGDYKGLHKTCSPTRTSPDTFSWSIFHKRVTRGSKGLRGIWRGDRGLQGVTGHYKWWQGATTGYMQGLQGLRAVTGDYKGLQKTCSVTRMSPDTFSGSIFHRRVTRGSKGLRGGE